ncbi:MAG: Coenzyme A biosynthesis bifunctional protein CoaBC [bacterium ADurb.Bin429]|nr:MAG: Coenzyme A biosynthesis bifunctional protein CoaBC [bacterium ADurb.Bin429]
MADASFRVMLGITGSIAAYKCADLVRKLRAMRNPDAPDRRVEVRAMLTDHGAQFITPVTLQTLTGFPVYQELFVSAEEWDVEHVGLADSADLLLIAPATANILAKLAIGLADDLLSSTALACTAPLLIAPAMNVHMWEHPATQANVAMLLERGAIFIGPDAGELACGYEGRGRMAPLETITAAVEAYFLHPRVEGPETVCDLRGLHVVVTAGPTREYLDPVRFLSNPSSGKMGYALAVAARRRGARVTLVSGPVNLPAPDGITTIPVVSTDEMADAALAAAVDADVVIGAAAPADFAPTERAAQKVKKAGRAGLEMQLVPTTDILATIGERKRPGQIIVAFAAESEELVTHAREKLIRKHADLIVANDITTPDAGFLADTNRALLLYPDGRSEDLPLQHKSAMADRILDAVVKLRNR